VANTPALVYIDGSRGALKRFSTAVPNVNFDSMRIQLALSGEYANRNAYTNANHAAYQIREVRNRVRLLSKEVF